MTAEETQLAAASIADDLERLAKELRRGLWKTAHYDEKRDRAGFERVTFSCERQIPT
jgi:hypothetical protein